MDITANRKRFIQALRENKNELNQIFNGFMRTSNGCCALGLGCYEFRIAFNSVEIAKKLGLSYSGLESDPSPESLAYIWDLNDQDKLSFSAIADNLEEAWGLK